MRPIFPLSFLFFAFQPITANADTIKFTLNETITFSLPLPLSGEAVNPDDLRIFEFPIDFNGHDTTAQLDLLSSAVGGGFNLTYSLPGGPGHLSAHGDQLFAGTTLDPTILTGTFELIDNVKGGTDTVTISRDTAVSTPEPPTAILFATGILALLLLIQWKKARHFLVRGHRNPS